MSERQPMSMNPEEIEVPDILPVLPLKETVVFPFVIMPLSVEPERGVAAVDHALAHDRLIMLVARRESEGALASVSQIFSIGTVGRIMRMLKLPDGRIRVLVQGLVRAELLALPQMEPFPIGRIRRVDVAASALEDDDVDPSGDGAEPSDDAGVTSEALMRTVRELLERAANMGQNVSPEVMVLAANLDHPGRLADLAASNLDLRLTDAQSILETDDAAERLRRVSELLHHELDVLTTQHRISSQAQEDMDRSHREYFLRQQLKAIQEELGEVDELVEEIARYRAIGAEKQLPAEALEELERQLRRLERSHPESGENTVIRTYLDWLTGLPWTTASEDDLNLDNARQILADDHYGLEKVKERIIEYLAVRRLKPDVKGPILCFVGPPGVGKTSLGRSIARALGRTFVRLSLGGVRDEAEIRGHRRTYVGAMPGRIVQGLHQAGTSNPVFMLDEIDKIGSDFRGDPSSALLEVLDPEQNDAFRDHYLGVAYDLSRVIFITTANLLEPIQPAFLDRMEVIRISGYTEEEKTTIARRHLVPKQIEANGLEPRHLHITDGGLQALIRRYTREAGLRNLERQIAAVARKTAVRVAEGDDKKRRVGPREVASLLGIPQFTADGLLDEPRVGVATGLAWTAAGGDLLLIEASVVPGRGKLQLTGHLGEVMRESGQTAMTFVRSWAARHPDQLRVELPPPAGNTDGEESHGNGALDLFARADIHVHAPAGSIPKDGPSAGITIATAIVSALSGRPVRRDLAMTGEITLRGDILPIGGLKEKALAARTAGTELIIVPYGNEKDLAELPAGLRRGLDIRCLRHLDDVLDLALLESGAP
ncbi:MAG: endopeptidase La [Acidobacteriota bacterium]